jgi:hypothetical protein
MMNTEAGEAFVHMPAKFQGKKKEKECTYRNPYIFWRISNALHRTNFRGTIAPKKFAKSTSKEHEKGNWYKSTSGFLGLNLFLEKKN